MCYNAGIFWCIFCSKETDGCGGNHIFAVVLDCPLLDERASLLENGEIEKVPDGEEV